MNARVGDFDWNDEAVERLRQACDDGYTAGQIVILFGDTYGIAITRSAIGGKIKRLGLTRGEAGDEAKMASTIPQPAPKSRAKPKSEWKRKGMTLDLAGLEQRVLAHAAARRAAIGAPMEARAG